MSGCSVITVGVLALFLSSGGCHSSEAPLQSLQTQSDKVQLRFVSAVLKEEPKREVEVATTAIGSSNEVRAAQFIDDRNGWAAGRQVMHKTSSAGESWKKLDLKLPGDSYISSFVFISPMRGWLTVIHNDETKPYPRGYSSSIMMTDDGGETWSEQAVFREVSLRHLAPWNADKGIAVGSRTTNHKPAHGEIFGVKTDDGGKTWKDFTQQLKPAIKGPYGFGHDEGRKIHWLSSKQIYLLTVRDRVLVSEDGAETWKSIAQFEEFNSDGSPKAATYHSMIFDTAGRLRLLGAQRGDEGFWSDFVVSGENASWESYELSRVPLFDAVFLSANEVLACGLEVKRNARPSGGIVLYSKDNGKNWSPVYRTKSSEMLISLTKISDTDFYAVSDIGNFIKLSLK